MQFLDRVTSSLNNGECVDVVYLDFAKAFDKVPHKRLLEKVKQRGIGGQVWGLISEWLSGTNQRVYVNGITLHGQGSHSFGRKKFQEFSSPISEFSRCFQS